MPRLTPMLRKYNDFPPLEDRPKCLHCQRPLRPILRNVNILRASLDNPQVKAFGTPLYAEPNFVNDRSARVICFSGKYGHGPEGSPFCSSSCGFNWACANYSRRTK